MELFQIWIFNFDFGMLFSFLFGVGIGIAVFALIYLFLVLSSMKDKKYIVMTSVKDVTDEEILEMIDESKKVFKDTKLKGADTTLGYCKDISTKLVESIARKFFPNSKHPMLELSVDEVIMLTSYISKRVDEILNHKGLKFVRRIKISQIISFTEVKEKIDDNEIVKATKRYKIKETFTAFKSVINVVNPIYWARKLVVNRVFDVIIKNICLAVIGIVGEETYKIYSKNVFNKDVSVDSGVDLLIDEAESKALEEVSVENGQMEDATDEISTSSTEPLMLDAPKKEEKKKSILNIFKKGGKANV